MRCQPQLAAALALAALAAPVQADEVRLHGATTVIDRVVTPYSARVEAATGSRLSVVGNATGKGLVDLASGRCDASLSSEPLEIAVSAAKLAGKVVDPSELKFHVVAQDEIVFVVHPSNPVRSLSWEQLRDIHTGKIKNWKDVGGTPAPITVFTDTVTGGTRAMIRHVVLGGAEYAPTAVALTSVRKVAEMVAASANAIGGLGKGFVDTARNRILETRRLERPLGFITVGEGSAKVRAVIQAYRDEVKKGAK